MRLQRIGNKVGGDGRSKRSNAICMALQDDVSISWGIF